MNYQEYFNEHLVSILDKYSLPGQHVGTDLVSLLKKSDTKELIIPLLGMQGMGKSTLINAILGEDIMPNEADETTCAPVEIKYGEKEEGRVYFEDGSSPVTVHTKEELHVYVDNNSNSGNYKHVERVVLFRNNELLKSGLTLVDLPGVGSLTRVNEETTKRYIQNLCTAIFVIPTVPTIRRTEAMFIKSVWSQFPTAVFVQNRWVGDTDLAVEESVPYNCTRLKQIAEQLNNPFDEHIIVVNAYEAIKGTLDNDSQMIADSNIGEIISKLQSISTEWEQTYNSAVYEKVLNTLSYTKGRIADKIEGINKSQEQLFEERKRLEVKYEKETSEITQTLKQARKELDAEQEGILSFVNSLTKEYTGQIRANIYNIIDKGVTDGYRLTEAFERIQEEEAEKAFESVFKKVNELKISTDKILERFGKSISIDEAFGPEFVSFGKESAFKFEKGLEVFLNIGGGVGGMLAYAPVAAKITEVASGVGSLAGPIGTAVGVLAGIAISAVVALVANKTKKTVTAQRGKGTKSEIEPSILESAANLKKLLLNKFDEFFDAAKTGLKDILEIRKQQYASLFKDIDIPLDNTDIVQAEKDLKDVIMAFNGLKN